jgi:hypothetical protein
VLLIVSYDDQNNTAHESLPVTAISGHTV